MNLKKHCEACCRKESTIFIAREVIRSYFQVTYLLASEQVVEREFGNLLKIHDNYPKYVISMDDFPVYTTHKGVQHIKLIDFLSK